MTRPHRRPVPSVTSIVLLVAVLTLVAAFVVGVTTQSPTSGARGAPTSIEELVLNGGGVTTTAPLSSAGRPVEEIPARGVGS